MEETAPWRFTVFEFNCGRVNEKQLHESCARARRKLAIFVFRIFTKFTSDVLFAELFDFRR